MNRLAAPSFAPPHRGERPGGVVLDVALGCVALAAVLFLLVAAPVPRDAAPGPADTAVADAVQIDMRERTPSDSIEAPQPR